MTLPNLFQIRKKTKLKSNIRHEAPTRQRKVFEQSKESNLFVLCAKLVFSGLLLMFLCLPSLSMLIGFKTLPLFSASIYLVVGATVSLTIIIKNF